MRVRLIFIALIGLLLASCAGRGPASVLGGECKIFEPPQFAVKGKTRYDQGWIDSQVAGGVGGCGWPRPKARPESLDAPAGARVVAAPRKKPGVIKRIRDRILPPAAAAPQPVPEPAVVAAPPPPEPPPPPPKPRDPVDELLNPTNPLPPARRR